MVKLWHSLNKLCSYGTAQTNGKAMAQPKQTVKLWHNLNNG